MDGLQLVGVLKEVVQNPNIDQFVNVVVICETADGGGWERQAQFPKIDRDTGEATPLAARWKRGDLNKLYDKRVVVGVAAETRPTSAYVNLRAVRIEAEETLRAVEGKTA